MQEISKARAATQAAVEKAKTEAGAHKDSMLVDKRDSEPHEKTKELVVALDQTEDKKEEPMAPPNDGLPEGASIFGG
jgi:hypothetical protein